MESVTVHISQELIDEALNGCRIGINDLWLCCCPIAKALSRIFGRPVSVNGYEWCLGKVITAYSGYPLPELVRLFINKIDDVHYRRALPDMSVLKPFSFELELPPGLKPVVSP